MAITITAIDGVHVLTLYGVFDRTTYPRIHHNIARTADHEVCRALIVDVTRLVLPEAGFWRQLSSTTPVGHPLAVPLALVCDSIAGQRLLRRSPVFGIISLHWSVAAANAALRAEGAHARPGQAHTNSHPESHWLAGWPTTPIETRYSHFDPFHPRPDPAVA